MVKNKVLTPVLAGVLGLSIVGSGLGYYFVNKDSNDGKTEGGKAKLTQVADNINNTLGTAEKAIKGELDFAYNATATVSFGEAPQGRQRCQHFYFCDNCYKTEGSNTRSRCFADIWRK